MNFKIKRDVLDNIVKNEVIRDKTLESLIKGKTVNYNKFLEWLDNKKETTVFEDNIIHTLIKFMEEDRARKLNNKINKLDENLEEDLIAQSQLTKPLIPILINLAKDSESIKFSPIKDRTKHIRVFNDVYLAALPC